MTSGGSCEQADAGEDVVVEYQPLGSSTYTQLMLLGYDRKTWRIKKDCMSDSTETVHVFLRISERTDRDRASARGCYNNRNDSKMETEKPQWSKHR